jgi:hypothetical protein
LDVVIVDVKGAVMYRKRMDIEVWTRKDTKGVGWQDRTGQDRTGQDRTGVHVHHIQTVSHSFHSQQSATSGLKRAYLSRIAVSSVLYTHYYRWTHHS